MKLRNANAISLLCTVAVIVLVMVPLAGSGFAQETANREIGIPSDWTHQHLIFSNPGIFGEAQRNGTYDRWVRIVNDPRYQLEQEKRAAMAMSSQATTTGYALAGNQVPAPQGWSMDLGVSAKVGAGQYPAKWSFGTDHAYCDSDTTPDFVVYNTGIAGTSSQPSIIAYDNLYSGCSGVFPLIYWRYNTGGTIPVSVVMTTDGTQLAFIQNTSSVASLVLLKWAKGSSLLTLSSISPGLYHACTAPCMTVIPLAGAPNVTRSAPFYDSGDDVLYVGDNSGVLHKFVNVFVSGLPGEVLGGGSSSGWPQTVSAGNILTGPLYDHTSGNVFVGSSGGTLIRIPADGGSSNIVTSGQVATGSGIADAPLVDSQAGSVYVFAYCDKSNTCTYLHSAKSAVFQFTTSFGAGTTGTEKSFGPSYTNNILYVGAFDNNYYQSGNQTGYLYVCGSGYGTSADIPTLYQVPITNNVLGTPVVGPWLAHVSKCSPVTEFLNGSTDRIFLSVAGEGRTGTPTNCPSGSNGCVMSFDVTNGSGFGTGKTTLAAATENGGTSGIIVDNSVSVPSGTSNVYFSTLTAQQCAGNGSTGKGGGGCAIQASQAGLN